MAKIHGIFTPHMVPLDEQGRINEAELRRLVDWLIAKGISGLYPNGSTGEFTRFSPEERRTIVRIVAEQAAGRVPILAGAAEANIETTLQACAEYAQLGCRAAAICAPYYFKLSQEAVCEYFAELARRSELDIFLYNIPQFANEISIETVKTLCKQPRIVGIKDSSRDFPRFVNLMNEVRPLRSDFVFFTGTEEILMPSLVMGADGGTIATSGVVPEAVMNLYRLSRSGALEAAREIQFGLLELVNAMLFGCDFPEGFRVALELRGFHMGRGRQPLSPRQKLDVERIRRQLQRLLSAQGVVEKPAGRGEEDLSQALLAPENIQMLARQIIEKLSEGRGDG